MGIGIFAAFIAIIGLIMAIFAWVARRVLDMHIGLIRLLFAALLVAPVGGGIMQAMFSSAQAEHGRYGSPALAWLAVLGALTAGLIIMILLVVAEILVPTGSVPSPLEMVRRIRGRAGRLRRYSQITVIAVRHGLGPYLRGRGRAGGNDVRLARSLRRALDEAGVTFVKLGQVLSTRRDLLPPGFVDELSRLQDDAALAPWPEIEAVLTAELGGPVETVFAGFDREPLAAASIAQVHTATLKTGEDVVVKVQRPGIQRVVERDLDIVDRLASTLDRRTTWGRGIGVRELAAGFAAALREELDFRIEAGNMAAVAATTSIVVPAAHEEHCTRRVLVMERLRGTPLGATDIPDRDALARTLLDTLLRQIMLDGVFHADPHPGNMLLLEDGRLALLDFGSVGRLDPTVRAALQQMMLAIDFGDPMAVTDALLEVVVRPDMVDEERLRRALGQFLARHLGAGRTPGAAMFTDLFRIVTAFGLAVLPEVAGVFRAMGTLEGALLQLAPGFNLVAEAKSFAKGYLVARLAPESLRDTAVAELAVLIPTLRRLPRRVDRIAGAIESGRLGVNVRLLADERDRRFISGLVHQAMLTVIAATAGIMAVLLLGTSGGPSVTPAISLYDLLGYNLLVIASALALRVVVLAFRRPRTSS